MARPLRLEFPGTVYHITARGDRRKAIFRSDEDRLLFIELLGKEVTQQGWLLYAFCLMDNHYHLLLETPQPNLVRGMRRLNGVYTQAFNRRHKRVGRVLQGRYKSILLEKDAYLRELCRYVVLNPLRVKKRPVKSVAKYPWSSYLPTAGKAGAPGWLAVAPVRALFGKSQETACRAYERYVAEGLDAPSPWKGLSGQIFLGSARFVKRMKTLAAVKPASDLSRAQRRSLRASANRVLKDIAREYGLTPKSILNRSNAEAFKMLIYKLRREANLPLRDVAALTGVSEPRVSQIQAQIER